MSENFILQFQLEPLITGVRDLTIECCGGVSDSDITQTYEINNVGGNHIIITLARTGTGFHSEAAVALTNISGVYQCGG